ncbi:efflux RND transporter periplasmic adaptor subunit [Pantoea sp.]|uniref:efflux RND transporter periplasmic adaptor subunit n=1 Tax=Pantoea sp. TaxID=69393 RepID=UPI0028A03711|nr:efflux RND transporter periplasmic adaptor subunit [Pantoea sp.]
MRKTAAFRPLALSCAFGFTLALTACDDKSAQVAEKQQSPQVKVFTVKTESLQITADLPGRTAAFRIAEVRPQVSGIILKRSFTEGSDVKAGQPLYQIDPAPFRAAFARAQAAVAQAQANARIAQATLKRYQSLIATRYVSQQDYDEATSTAEQARATVESAKAALETARINLAWSRVISPISGRTGLSTVTEGALVQEGQSDALTRVQQLDPIYVDVTQSADAYLRLQQAFAAGELKQKAGKAEVQVLLQDGTHYPFTGALAFSDVTVDHTTGAITLRAIVPNPEHKLLPGMFVRARLDEGVDPQAMLIPQQAVTRTPRGDATALVVGSDNKVETRAIRVTQAEGDKWRVSAGLQPGERIIVSGLQRAQPGMTVSPSEISAAPSATASSSTPARPES